MTSRIRSLAALAVVALATPAVLASHVAPAAAASPAAPGAPGDVVSAAADLAQAGSRDAAIALLEARVRQVPDDVEAHALLGVLHRLQITGDGRLHHDDRRRGQQQEA